MKIYIAASFSCDSREETERRKQAINSVVAQLRALMPKNEFYVPHELVIKNAWEISLAEWAHAVYNADVDALRHSQLVIFLSFGKNNNAGSVWECGCAYGYGIPVIVIRMTESTESIMLFGSARAIIDNWEIASYDWETRPRYFTPSLFKTQYTLS